MAHHIYHTDAIVLGGQAAGEANKYFSLFTRELGMIEAVAQSVRLVASKLRPSLGDLSQSSVSLVRGKNGWKVTNAVLERDFFRSLRGGHATLIVMSNVSALLKRLLHGEEKNEALYDLVLGAFDFLAENDLNEEEIANAECVLVLNVLRLLGYVGRHDDLESLTGGQGGIFSWNKELLSMVQPLRRKALSEINRSLKESHL